MPAVKGDPATPFITARGAVAAWECDQLGHMSAHLYYSRASDGIGHIRHRMGITQEITRRHHWGGAALEYDVRFLAEMAAGDIYSLRSGLLDLADKTFRFGHCLHNDSTGEISATFDVVACMFDLQARRAMPIPDEVRARAEGLMIPWPPSEWTEARAAE